MPKTPNDPVIFAYQFDGSGTGLPLEGEAVSKTVKSPTLAWVHLNANHAETQGWLRREVSYLDPLIVDGLLAEETRPRFTEFGDGVLLILRGMNLNENARPEDMISIRIWVDSQRIISIQRRVLKAVRDIEDRLQQGRGPKNVGAFVSVLVHRLLERMEPVLTELGEATDGIEEQVLSSAEMQLRGRIVNIRRQAIIFRRYIAPQRDAISQLRTADLSWLGERDKRQLQESYNNVMRYIEDLDAVRERAQIVKDELATIIADRMNKNMYVLSVIAAVFLPISFLTGLFGINIGGMPGVDSDAAFLIFSAILMVVVIVQVWVFKKFKWF